MPLGSKIGMPRGSDKQTNPNLYPELFFSLQFSYVHTDFQQGRLFFCWQKFKFETRGSVPTRGEGGKRSENTTPIGVHVPVLGFRAPFS